MAELSSLPELERAFMNAHQAGDTQAASVLAEAIRQRRNATQPTQTVPLTEGMVREQAAMKTAEEVGPAEAALIAAGRGVAKVGAGLEQMVTNTPEALKRGQQESDQAFAALQAAHPVATTAGEVAPYVAVPASMGVLPAALTVGGIEAAKYGTPGERLGRGAMGAVTTGAGGLLSRAGANLIAPVTQKAAGQANQEALAAASRLGVKPTLSQVTGRPLLARMEDYAARAPGGAGVMTDFAARNAAAVNRAAASAIGENADELTAGVFAQAAKRMGQVFESIKNLPGKPIKITQNVATAADDILRQQGKMIPAQQDAALVQLANQAKVLAANKGRIDGETYQLIRSGLSESSFDASGTNKVLYGKLLKALDDAADTSLRASGNAALADSLKAVRPQYANLMMLEKGAVAEAGNVSAPRLASVMRTQNPGAFRRGQMVGPMADIARVGEGLKPLRAGSPTFEREAISNPISLGLNALWSYPLARIATSPVARFYPQAFGGTSAARGLAQIADPTGRTAIAAAMQGSGMLPFIPQMAE